MPLCPLDAIVFPDAALEAAVRAALGRVDDDDPLYPEDLLWRRWGWLFWRFSARGAGIADLTGLEHARLLSVLDLADNAIADLTPLAALEGLRIVDLSGNAIDDLGPLRHLDRLYHLDVANNAVRDLTPLAGLDRLAELDLEHNHVQDLMYRARFFGHKFAGLCRVFPDAFFEA